MMTKKSNSFMYLGGSVALIIAAIAVTAVIDRSKNSQTSSEDIRTKAGTSTSLQFTGSVATVDQTKGVFSVDNLQFASSAQTNQTNLLGQWTVTPPPSFNIASLGAGSRVTMTVDPTTFLITSHTVTATQITVNR